MAQYKLNYPIETPNAMAHWESRHRLNRVKAIMAFSLDLDNANDNLRRAGYYRQYRKRYLEVYECIVNKPNMDNVPLSDLTEHWWNPNHICPLTPPAPVTAISIGDLSSLVAGQRVPRPTLTMTPTNHLPGSQTWSTSPVDVAILHNDDKTIELLKAGDFTLTVTFNNPTGSTPADVTQTKTYTVTAAPKVYTHDVAIFPDTGYESKTDTITHDGEVQTISLRVGDVYNGEIFRVNTDGTGYAGNNSTISPASSDTVASYVMVGKKVVITANAIGTVDYTLESGDNSARKTIRVVVIDHPDEYPRFVNDSHTAAPWNPIYVSDTEWKLDNATPGGTVRYFAVWYSTKANLSNTNTTPPTISGAKVTSWSSSDESIVSVDFTGSGANVAGARNFHFKALTGGTATLTATTDRGEIIKLYVGVGQPAIISGSKSPSAPPLAFSKNLPANNTTVKDGDSFNFIPTVVGGTPPYHYKWFHDSNDGKGGVEMTAVGDDSKLGLISTAGYYADGDAGQYWVEVTDSATPPNQIISNKETIVIEHRIHNVTFGYSNPNAQTGMVEVWNPVNGDSVYITKVTKAYGQLIIDPIANPASLPIGELSVTDAGTDTSIAEVVPVKTGDKNWVVNIKAAGETTFKLKIANYPNEITVRLNVTG